MDLSAVRSELVAEEPIVESVRPDPHVVVQLQQVSFPGSCSIMVTLNDRGSHLGLRTDGTMQFALIS